MKNQKPPKTIKKSKTNLKNVHMLKDILESQKSKMALSPQKKQETFNRQQNLQKEIMLFYWVFFKEINL